MARGATTTREDWPARARREDLTTTARVVVVDVVVENADMIDRLVDVNGAVDDEKKVVCRVCSSEDHAVRAHVDDCRRASTVVVAIIVRGGIADAHDSDIRRSGKYTSVMGFCFLKYSSETMLIDVNSLNLACVIRRRRRRRGRRGRGGGYDEYCSGASVSGIRRRRHGRYVTSINHHA